jgi:CheY-like chemotaxis protein
MITLLLVEDHRDNREVLTVMLGQKYTVASYGSAAEALTALIGDGVRPELLVLDIGMKPVDGLECLTAIRALPRYSTTPAIALTGYAREVDRQAFLAAGFQAVVTKPILDHPELETLIDRLLRRARNERFVGHGILTGVPDGSMIFGRGGTAA